MDTLINISKGVFIHMLFVIACVLIMLFLVKVIENFILIIKTSMCWQKMKPNTQYTTFYNYYDMYDELSDIYTEHIINIKNIDGPIIDCNITKITHWDENDDDISTWDESDHWYKIITKYDLYDGTIKNI